MKRYLVIVLGVVLSAILLAPVKQASAQQATHLNAPSPEKIAVTSGGVDIRTGRYAYSSTDVSIGDGGGAISVERTMVTPILGMMHLLETSRIIGKFYCLSNLPLFPIPAASTMLPTFISADALKHSNRCISRT